jgi:hypothetical protein
MPALVFAEQQVKSREGGPRDPYHFENVYRIVRDVEAPIVLLDDVCTTGAHMIGACWKLKSPKRNIVLGPAAARGKHGSKRGGDCSARTRRRSSLIAEVITAKIWSAAPESSQTALRSRSGGLLAPHNA